MGIGREGKNRRGAFRLRGLRVFTFTDKAYAPRGTHEEEDYGGIGGRRLERSQRSSSSHTPGGKCGRVHMHTQTPLPSKETAACCAHVAAIPPSPPASEISIRLFLASHQARSRAIDGRAMIWPLDLLLRELRVDLLSSSVDLLASSCFPSTRSHHRRKRQEASPPRRTRQPRQDTDGGSAGGGACVL